MNKVKDRIFQKLYSDEVIRAAFKAILGREPEPEGLEEYRKVFAKSDGLTELLTGILVSDEFKQKHFAVLAPDMVVSIYRSMLSRDPDPSGLATYTQKLTGPGGLTAVLGTIAGSREFARKCYPASGQAGAMDDSCIVFLHIQKTGGTSLQNMFSASYGEGLLYKEHADTLHRHLQDELSRYSVFAGHFNHDSLSFLPRKKRSIFTFLREPKQRLVSLYYFLRAHEPSHANYQSGMKLANELMIEPFFENGQIIKESGFWNHMTWAVMGHGKWNGWRNLLSRQKNPVVVAELLEKNIRPAIRKRLSEFTFIGLQEDFDRSVDMLYRVLGKRRPETIRADHSLEKLINSEANFKKKIERQPMTPNLDAALDNLVQLDNIVYEEGKKLFAEQCAKISFPEKDSAGLPAIKKAASLPFDLAPINVESDATEEQLLACLIKIEAAWAHLGKAKPHFSVLSQKEFLPQNLDSSIEGFWDSGENEAARIERILARHGFPSLATKTCVEYGCGVGRVSTGLARRFASVHGYDISSPHLSHAKQRANEVAANNIIFHLCTEQPLEAIIQCDVFYSKLVFQHNPPPVISKLIRLALQALKPEGIGIFQVPTYISGYGFNLAEWLVEEHALGMQMHCLPQRKIFEIIAEENCFTLEIREDDSTGEPEKFLSNTFVVRKSE